MSAMGELGWDLATAFVTNLNAEFYYPCTISMSDLACGKMS